MTTNLQPVQHIPIIQYPRLEVPSNWATNLYWPESQWVPGHTERQNKNFVDYRSLREASVGLPLIQPSGEPCIFTHFFIICLSVRENIVLHETSPWRKEG